MLNTLTSSIVNDMTNSNVSPKTILDSKKARLLDLSNLRDKIDEAILGEEPQMRKEMRNLKKTVENEMRSLKLEIENIEKEYRREHVN